MCDGENLKLEAHVQVCWEAHGEAVCLVTDDRAVSPVSSFHPLTAPHPHSVPFLILSKRNIRLTLMSCLVEFTKRSLLSFCKCRLLFRKLEFDKDESKLPLERSFDEHCAVCSALR